MKVKNMIVCALFAAIMCITAPFSIPLGPVPITLILFSIGLTAFVTGSRKAMVATIIYMLVGLVGLPVFSGFKGGLGAIMSPVGGFVFSYIFIALILGQCVKCRRKSSVFLLCGAALLVCYMFGVSWYMFITEVDMLTALSLCVIPFIPFDIIKLCIAYFVGKVVRLRLVGAKLL